MPLSLQQLETIQAACSDTVYELLDRRLEAQLQAAAEPLEAKFSFENAVAILKSKPELFERLDRSARYAAADAHGRMSEEGAAAEVAGESKEKPSRWSALRTEYNQLVEDWKELARCTQNDSPVSPELRTKLLRAIPNFNPRYVAHMALYEAQLASEIGGVDAATSIASLVRLRESCLGMTPLTEIGAGYAHLLHRLGRVPYNLDKQGSTATQEEITAVIRMYIEMRITDAHLARERKSTAAETIRRKDAEIAELTKLVRDKHLLTEGLIEELGSRNKELKEVRQILAEVREGKNEEKRRRETPATPLLRTEEREKSICGRKTKIALGSIFLVGTTAGGVTTAVILANKTKKSDGDCAEPEYPIVYDASLRNSPSYSRFLDFILHTSSTVRHSSNMPEIYDAIEFVSGANITKITADYNTTIERAVLPGVGFKYKVIFIGGWKDYGGDIYFQCQYDLPTSIGPMPGIINPYPPKNHPVYAYIRDYGKVSVPIDKTQICTTPPKHNYIHGAYFHTNAPFAYPLSKLTHFFLNFAFVQADGTLSPSDTSALGALAGFRLRNPHLHQEIYWVIKYPCPDVFNKIVIDPATLAKLQQNLLKAVFNIDAAGIVWDIYFDKSYHCETSFNETLFIRLQEETAAILQSVGKKMHLALPAVNPLSPNALCKIGRIIDKAHLKTFYYDNKYPGVSGDAAGLHQVVNSVKTYLGIQDGGNPCLRPEQVLVGTTSSWHSVSVANTSTNYGYGQTTTGGLGNWGYRYIISEQGRPPFYLNTLSPAQSPSGLYSAQAWAYEPNGTEVLSFDTPYSICKKIAFIKETKIYEEGLGGYFLDADSDTYSGALTNAADAAFSNESSCSPEASASANNRIPESATKELLNLPSELIGSMARAATDGLFYGFLYELHRRGLAGLLKPHGYSAQQIYAIEKALQTVYNFGTWGCAAPGFSLLLARLGLPRETVDKVIGNTALATGLWFSFWPTLGCMFGSTAGAWAAEPVYRRVVKPAATTLDTSAATAVEQWVKPLASMAGTLAGTAAQAVREVASNGTKTRMGAVVSATASMAGGIAVQAVQQYRKSWLGSVVGSATAPTSALSNAVLDVASSTRLGAAVGSAANATKVGFWAKVKPAVEATRTSPIPASHESLASTERVAGELV